MYISLEAPNGNAVFVGVSECEHTFEMHEIWGKYLEGVDPIFPAMYYVCGKSAYYKLLKNWYGRCNMGIIFPKNYHVKLKGQLINYNERTKRIANEIAGDIFGVLMPSVGEALNSQKIRKLSTIVDKRATSTTRGFSVVNEERILI